MQHMHLYAQHMYIHMQWGSRGTEVMSIFIGISDNDKEFVSYVTWRTTWILVHQMFEVMYNCICSFYKDISAIERLLCSQGFTKLMWNKVTIAWLPDLKSWSVNFKLSSLTIIVGLAQFCFTQMIFHPLLLLSLQVCVLHTVQHAPVISEYSVSGTTYAPEGLIFDSTGLQVIYFCIFGILISDWKLKKNKK